MKVFLDTIGCRLNQAEIESMARQFRAAGHEIVPSAEIADMAVMNTCAVTNDAAADSRRKIRQLSRAGVKKIIATGCWSTLQPQVASHLPNVLRVVPNDRKDSLVAEALNFNSGSNIQSSDFDLEPIVRIPLPGLHRRTRAFIKVQDGCDNHCTFCITTVARGEGRSRPLAEVLQDIQFALDGGAKEIVLTGVHLGSWGYDLGAHLFNLVRSILRQTDTPRLRLSSLEPWDLDAEFFQLWEDKRLMPHLHLPLQSGSESTLRRMARKTTPDLFRQLVSDARKIIPNVAITTDIIAGFPGETEDEFAETLDFVNQMNFAGGHVFTFSPRPGTGAAKMKAQVKPQLRKTRNHILTDALAESARCSKEKFIGYPASVLWESTSEMGGWGWRMEGWTENYIRVRAVASSPRWNEVNKVRLLSVEGELMNGEIIPSGN